MLCAFPTSDIRVKSSRGQGTGLPVNWRLLLFPRTLCTAAKGPTPLRSTRAVPSHSRGTGRVSPVVTVPKNCCLSSSPCPSAVQAMGHKDREVLCRQPTSAIRNKTQRWTQCPTEDSPEGQAQGGPVRKHPRPTAGNLGSWLFLPLCVITEISFYFKSEFLKIFLN